MISAQSAVSIAKVLQTVGLSLTYLTAARRPFKGESCAWQLVSKDKKKSFVLYANQKGTANPKPLFLKLKGLESDSVYKVLQLGIEISGKTLMNAGIPVVTNTADYSTITFDIVKK